MKLLTATVVLAFAFAGTAQAHSFHFHPSLAKRSLTARAAGQRQILRHDRSVLRSTAWLAKTDRREPLTGSPARLLAVRNFHAAQSRWVRRELRETLARIHAQRSARADRRMLASRSGGWSHSLATWYGPGFYGHGPACGGFGVLTESSWWVATVPAQCGVMFTICDGGRCVRAPGGDTGGFAPGNFDLTPAVARALGGLYTHSVRWRRG